MYDVSISPSLAPPWLTRPPRRLGAVPSSLPTADVFVLVSRHDGAPQARFDLSLGDGAEGATKALFWEGWLVIGARGDVYLASLETDDAAHIVIDQDHGEAFTDFWLDPAFLLVVSRGGLMRIGRDRRVAWRNHGLALDGVSLTSVTQRSIRGEGEWDPPDGWRPFEVSTETGEALSA